MAGCRIGSTPETILLEFLAQGCPADAQDLRCAGLIALGVAHHRVEQRGFDFTEHQSVEFRRLVAIEVLEVAIDHLTRKFTQRALAMTG